MSFRDFLIALFAASWIVSCNNSVDTKAARADSTTLKLIVRVANVEEKNDFTSLPKDSMKVAYQGTADTLYGHRKGNILYVGGDMLFNYPPLGKKGVATLGQLWKVDDDSITLPYQVDPKCGKQKSIDSAFNMWTTSLKVRFVLRTRETAYVTFIHSENTESFVGRKGGKQTIEIGDGAWKGSIAHEIGHALGLYHEQMRRDRNKYVRVNCEEDIDLKQAFESDPYAIDTLAYNYFSIMHYSPSICMDILKVGLPSTIPGQRDSITLEDFTTVRIIYKLP